MSPERRLATESGIVKTVRMSFSTSGMIPSLVALLSSLITSSSEFCTDGSPRRSGSNSLVVGRIELCEKDNPCHQQLGQICIVVGGARRCVCRIGMVRPLGSVKCIPVEMVDEYLKHPEANCTELNEDLLMELEHSTTYSIPLLSLFQLNNRRQDQRLEELPPRKPM